MNTIEIATFDKSVPAEGLKAQLAAAGITAEIHDKSKVGRLWLTPRDRAAFRLEVAPADHGRALRFLRESTGAAAAMRAAIHCPECGSARVEYPQMTRKFLLPNLVAFLSVIHIIEKKYYCEECHWTWSPGDAKPRRSRRHLAPYYFIEGLPEANSARAPATRKQA